MNHYCNVFTCRSSDSFIHSNWFTKTIRSTIYKFYSQISPVYRKNCGGENL